MRSTRALVLGLFLVSFSAGRAPVGAREGALSVEVRRGLSQRMQGHGQDMTQLLWSVVLLEHRDTRNLARGIRQMDRVPADAPNVPRDFLEMQDNLLQAAAVLAHAPDRGNADEVAQAFGALMRSCVACHSRYLP